MCTVYGSENSMNRVFSFYFSKCGEFNSARDLNADKRDSVGSDCGG